MRKLYILGLIATAALIIGLAWAEQMTFSTYYPAPYGVYNEMRARRMAIGGNYLDSVANPVADDNLIVEGNVGIGTTTPGQKLDVAGILEISGGTTISEDGFSFRRSTAGSDHSGTIQAGHSVWIDIDDDESGTDANFQIRSNNAKTIVLTALESGNVGIGTATPEKSLHIKGTVDYGYILIESIGAHHAGIGLIGAAAGDVEWHLLSGYPGDGDFTIRSSEKFNAMTIKKTTGNVGIRTASPEAPAPNNEPGNLDVNDVYLRSTGQWVSGGGFSPASYNGEESITFPNGMIMKMGFVADGGGSYASVNFDTAFGTLVSITFAEKHATSVATSVISAANENGFTIHDFGTYDGFYWQAWGY